MTPKSAHVIVVGDVSLQQARAMISDRLGAWQGGPTHNLAPADAKGEPKQIALVHKPGVTQSQVMVGGLGLCRKDPDYFPAVITNAILGGLFNSRLNMNLREDKGWTYGVRSNFTFLRARGPFAVSTSIRADATLDGIKEIFAEINRMRDENVTDEELQAAKNRYTLSLPANFEGLGGIAQMIGTLALHELPPDYYGALPAAIGKVTADDVRKVMRAHLDPENMSIVVVGDAATLEAPLRALNLGPVHLRDGDGALSHDKIKSAKKR